MIIIDDSLFHIAHTAVTIAIGSPALWALFKILTLLREFGIHRHQEKQGALHAEGIVKAESLNGR